jgi:hypothetical protein
VLRTRPGRLPGFILEITMLTLNDINNIEVDEDVPEMDYFLSIQRAINSGMWGLQGSYGRAMMEAINAGYCMLGTKSARDYYGNYIPSREDVKLGTKGSYDFVIDNVGLDWARAMEAA